jgi:RNA polymerase sigma-70 factor (ECF subfamily)
VAGNFVTSDYDPGSTASTLIERLKVRESQAWSRLNQLYGPIIYAWCRRAGMAPEDAADILQEVFRALVRRVGDFRRDRPGDTFRGWLWTVTHNKIRDHRRLAKDRAQGAGGTDAQRRWLELADEPPGGEADDDASLLHRWLELLRREFEDRTWQAFWRTTVELQYAADVADELGMTLNAVYKAKARVLARLRQELADLME